MASGFKNIWIIGASSGIGLELAKLFLDQGTRVIASARDTKNSAKLQELATNYSQNLSLIDIDATSKDSIKQAFETIKSSQAPLDLCMYNAGAYEKMKTDAWDLAKFEQMNSVNYLGALYLLDAILPYFKEEKRGRIVFNISIASYFGLPYGGGYSAPKAALRNLCESLQPELMAYNIELQTINHGFVRTRLTAKNDFQMPQLLEPIDAAKSIHKGLLAPYRFEIKFPFLLTSVLHLLQTMPYKLALAITKKAL